MSMIINLKEELTGKIGTKKKYCGQIMIWKKLIKSETNNQVNMIRKDVAGAKGANNRR